MAREPSIENLAMNDDLLMILKTIKKRSPRKNGGGNKGERGRTMNLKDTVSSLNRRKAKRAVAVSITTPEVDPETPA